MKIFSSLRLRVPSRPCPCKAHLRTFFSLPPSSHLSYHSQQPLGSGRHQPKSLLCSRFPQTYRPPSSGGWMRLRCRQTSVRTTTSGCGFTSTFATNTVILQPPRPPWAPFSPSSHPKTSRWARGARPPLLFGSSSRQDRASHLLLANYDLQTIQRLLGHSDIKTTMIYLQTVPSVILKEAKSPLDCL